MIHLRLLTPLEFVASIPGQSYTKDLNVIPSFMKLCLGERLITVCKINAENQIDPLSLSF